MPSRFIPRCRWASTNRRHCTSNSSRPPWVRRRGFASRSSQVGAKAVGDQHCCVDTDNGHGTLLYEDAEHVIAWAGEKACTADGQEPKGGAHRDFAVAASGLGIVIVEHC